MYCGLVDEESLQEKTSLAHHWSESSAEQLEKGIMMRSLVIELKIQLAKLGSSCNAARSATAACGLRGWEDGEVSMDLYVNW